MSALSEISESPMPPTALLVLGMHRSGTSALARVLNILGVDLGPDLLPPAADNELGFWEHRQVQVVHGQLLQAVGHDWNAVSPLPGNWVGEPGVEPHRTELRKIIERDFSQSRLWGLKDPRLCQTLPLWRSLLGELKQQAKCIIILRNPGEVARSLAKRDGMTAARAYMLWLRSVLQAEQDSRGLPRTLLTYDDLLAGWQKQMERVGRELGIDWPVGVAEAAPAIADFLRPTLRHHAVENEQFLNDEQVPTLVRELYAAGLTAAAEGSIDGLSATADRIGKELDESQPILSGFLFDAEREYLAAKLKSAADVDTLHGIINSLREQLSTAQSSQVDLDRRLGESQQHGVELTEHNAAQHRRITELEAQSAGHLLSVRQLQAKLREANDLLAAGSEQLAGERSRVAGLEQRLAEQVQANGQLSSQIKMELDNLDNLRKQMQVASLQHQGEIDQLKQALAAGEQQLLRSNNSLNDYEVQHNILYDFLQQMWQSRSWRWTAFLRAFGKPPLDRDHLVPITAMQSTGSHHWVVDKKAQFVLQTQPIAGKIKVLLKLKSSVASRAYLYFDTGQLFNPRQRIDLGAVNGDGKTLEVTYDLPEPTHCFRLDPVQTAAEFTIEEFVIQPLGH